MRKPKYQRAAMDDQDETKLTSLRMPGDLHTRFKMVCAKRGQPMAQVLNIFIQGLVEAEMPKGRGRPIQEFLS